MQNTVQRIQDVAAHKLATTYAISEQYNSLMGRSREILGEINSITYKPTHSYQKNPLSFFSALGERGKEQLVDNLSHRVDKLAAEFGGIQEHLAEQRERMSSKLVEMRKYSMGIEKAMADFQDQRRADVEVASAEEKKYEASVKAENTWRDWFTTNRDCQFDYSTLQQAGLPMKYYANLKNPSFLGIFSRPKQIFTGAEAAVLVSDYIADLKSHIAQEQKKIDCVQSGDTVLNQQIRTVAGVLNKIHVREKEYRNCIAQILETENTNRQIQDRAYLASLKVSMETRVEKGAERLARRRFAFAQGLLGSLALVGGLAYFSSRVEKKIDGIPQRPAAAAPVSQPKTLESVTNDYFTVIPGKENDKVLLHGPKTALFAEGYVYKGTNPGPTAMIIGGIHPNEHASNEAVKQIARTLEVYKGNVIVIPTLNRPADAQNTRGIDTVDMNRIWTPSVKNVAEKELVDAIEMLAKQYNVDLVLSTHTNNTGGYDNSFVSDTVTYADIAQGVVQRMNPQLGSGVGFKSMHKPMPTTLTYYFAQQGIPAFGVETRDNLPLKDGVELQKFAIKSMLDNYGIETNLEAEVAGIRLAAPMVFQPKPVQVKPETEATSPVTITPLKPLEPALDYAINPQKNPEPQKKEDKKPGQDDKKKDAKEQGHGY